MKLFDPGKLRHRVTFERYTELLDTAGEVVQDPDTGDILRDWVEVATVWAAIEPLSAREFVAQQQIQSAVTARITIRYREGLDASMRIRHSGRIYNIQGILADPESGREWITLPVSVGEP